MKGALYKTVYSISKGYMVDGGCINDFFFNQNPNLLFWYTRKNYQYVLPLLSSHLY